MNSDEDNNVIHVDFGGAASSEPVEDPTSKGLASGTAEEKLRIFSDLVEDGTVMVTLDARRPGVVVPAQFATDFRLNLNFDHLFRIPDFDYDAEGVRASLSFGGVDQWCDVPWGAVYMMRSLESTEVVLFPAHLPPEMMAIIPEIERAIMAHQEGGDSDTDE